MLGINDFVNMPKKFIDFLTEKLSTDMREKNEALFRLQEKNIKSYSIQILKLQSDIAKYFSEELTIAKSMYPEPLESLCA